MATGKEGEAILVLRTRGRETSCPSHRDRAPGRGSWWGHRAGAGALGLGPAPLRLSVLTCSIGAPGRPPGLTPTLRPAELSEPERPWPASAELDEPDSSDSEVGPQPRASCWWGCHPGPPRLRGRPLALTTPSHRSGGPEPRGRGHREHVRRGAQVFLHRRAWAQPTAEEEAGLIL